MQKQEIWKTVEGFNGDYKISNFGNLIMFYHGKWQPKASFVSKAGYLQTTLQRNKVKRNASIHRLVAEQFVEGWFEGAEVNHKDLNKLNNRWDNLEWVTREENQKHQFLAYHKDYVEPTCEKCGKKLSSKRPTLCVDCYNEIRREHWPSKEQLLQDLLYMSKVKIGEKYNKTDNWVKKVCKIYGLPITKDEIIQLRKDNGTYVPSKNSLRLTKEERYVHYEINGMLKTAHEWSKYLGLEGKRIGRYANKHTYEETVEYIKSFI